MASRHKTEKSSIGPNQPHSREVEHPAIDSKNTFEVPFDFSSSQSFERYPPEIPNQDSSSNKELQGVSSEEPLYLISKTEVNQLRRHTRAYLKSLGQIPIIYQIPTS